jgi:hypothetical protein
MKTKVDDLKVVLSKSQNAMFADRESPNDAFEYAQTLAKAEGMTPSVMATAIMVYHNTLIRSIEELLEE